MLRQSSAHHMRLEASTISLLHSQSWFVLLHKRHITGPLASCWTVSAVLRLHISRNILRGSPPHCKRAGNSQHIQTLAFVARTLLDCLEKGVPPGAPQAGQKVPARAARSPAAAPARVLTVNDFLFATGLDNVNLFQLLRHARSHMLCNGSWNM